MSADNKAPKEIAALLRLAAAALDSPENYEPEEISELIVDLDSLADELYPPD